MTRIKKASEILIVFQIMFTVCGCGNSVSYDVDNTLTVAVEREYNGLIDNTGRKDGDSDPKGLNSFADSKPKSTRISSKTEIGDIVVFGNYEQDGNEGNGKEEIQWRVIDKDDNAVMLISEKTLDLMRYHDHDEDYYWASCSLRVWLNDEFYNAAFSEDEKLKMRCTKVAKDYDAPMGRTDTQEAIYVYDSSPAVNNYVFLLDGNQVLQYFSSNKERQAEPTEYTKDKLITLFQGSNSAEEAKSIVNERLKAGGWRWWIKSDGTYRTSAFFIDDDGSVRYTDVSPTRIYECVRPVIWVNY